MHGATTKIIRVSLWKILFQKAYLVFWALSHLLHFYTPKFQKQDFYLCSGAGPVRSIDPDMVCLFDKNSDRDKK